MDRRLENNSFESVRPCRPQAGDRWGCSGMGVCSNESRSQSHHLPVPLLPHPVTIVMLIVTASARPATSNSKGCLNKITGCR